MPVKPDPIKTDFLVIGSGIAGLRAAIELGKAGEVLILTKDLPDESNTSYAQGGIAVALSDEDEVSLHYEDTIRAGDGMCSPEAVKVLVEEGIKCIQELIDWGMAFDHQGSRLSFSREAAHSRSRVLHAKGDSTGREVQRDLLKKAYSNPRIHFSPHNFCLNLLVEGGKVWGGTFLSEEDSQVKTVLARSTVLATGGAGQVYSETTNPDLATGDGVTIAHRAGALLSDMEFVQFHPTVLFIHGAPRFLLTEAIRGEGGYLRNLEGFRFMRDYHEAGEMAPRDVVSRAIVAELKKKGGKFVYLDLTHLNETFVRKRFPMVYSTCLNYGIDITVDKIPVHPAAHYLMGRVKTDLYGRTSLPNLYAAGEVACTDVHRANRLAGNSLLEGLVFGSRVGLAVASEAPPTRSQFAETPLKPKESSPTERPELGEAKSTAQKLMWGKVGILRDGSELKEGLRLLMQLRSWGSESPLDRVEWECANLMSVGKMILISAMAREESRGAHFRSDFPCRNDREFNKHSVLSKSNQVEFVSV
jgi:L-aspartate oxidase